MLVERDQVVNLLEQLAMRHPRPGVGSATELTANKKVLYSQYLNSFSNLIAKRSSGAVAEFLRDDANVKIGHPVNDVRGC